MLKDTLRKKSAPQKMLTHTIHDYSDNDTPIVRSFITNLEASNSIKVLLSRQSLEIENKLVIIPGEHMIVFKENEQAGE